MLMCTHPLFLGWLKRRRFFVVGYFGQHAWVPRGPHVGQIHRSPPVDDPSTSRYFWEYLYDLARVVPGGSRAICMI